MSYSDVLYLQNKEFNNRIECRKKKIPLPADIVLFVEHRPVYTLGKHGKISNLLYSEEELKSHGIEMVCIGRGGDITYHGPGQLTVYPIFDLQKYHLGVKDYVWLLEETVIKTLLEYGLASDRIEGKPGVWIGKGTEAERKICAIGIKCSRFVSMHGFALNVGMDISGFRGINPCGLSKDVTSISLEIGRNIEVREVEEIVWTKIKSLFQLHIPSPRNS